MTASISAMNCPLCGKTLDVLNDFDEKLGRFHCPACFPTSKEAQLGWLPRAAVQRQVRAKRASLTDPTFALDHKGAEITKLSRCECGREFTQRLLSADYLTIVERHSARAIAAITRQIPGYFVPVHCPPCERKDLGRQARLDDSRTFPDNYVERDHAAD